MEQKISKAVKNMLYQLQHAYGNAVAIAAQAYTTEIVEALRKKYNDTKAIALAIDKGELISNKILESLYRHVNVAIKNYAETFVNAVVESLKDSVVEEPLPGQMSFNFEEPIKEETEKFLVSYVKIYSDDRYDYIEKYVTQEQYEALCELQDTTPDIRDLKILERGGE